MAAQSRKLESLTNHPNYIPFAQFSNEDDGILNGFFSAELKEHHYREKHSRVLAQAGIILNFEKPKEMLENALAYVQYMKESVGPLFALDPANTSSKQGNMLMQSLDAYVEIHVQQAEAIVAVSKEIASVYSSKPSMVKNQRFRDEVYHRIFPSKEEYLTYHEAAGKLSAWIIGQMETLKEQTLQTLNSPLGNILGTTFLEMAKEQFPSRPFPGSIEEVVARGNNKLSKPEIDSSIRCKSLP